MQRRGKTRINVVISWHEDVIEDQFWQCNFKPQKRMLGWRCFDIWFPGLGGLCTFFEQHLLQVEHW